MSFRLGVVGSPISHSLSPVLHRAALAHWGLEGTSQAVDVDQAHAHDVSLMLESYYGLSVTMPLKEVVLAQCDELDDTAQRVGAVNTLARRNGVIWGRNTDGVGCVDALRSEFSIDLSGSTCVVRGSGGTARSLVDALVGSGCAQVNLVARNVAVAAQIAQKYSVLRVNPSTITDADLIINTVPYSESSDEMIEPPMSWSESAAAYDVVYVPGETPWLRAQREAGRRVANGLSMLVHQARHQLEWWFERTISPDVLFEAVRT